MKGGEQPIAEPQATSIEEAGWEMARKRSAKRALSMTDFERKDQPGKHKELGGTWTRAFKEFGSRREIGDKKDAHKNGTWDSQVRGNKHGEFVYRARDYRAHQAGRGRPSTWPVSLYQARKDASGQQRRALDNSATPEVARLETSSKRKGKEIAGLGEDEMGMEVEAGDTEKVMEDRELCLEDYDIEEHGPLIEEMVANSDTYLNEEGGYDGESTGNQKGLDGFYEDDEDYEAEYSEHKDMEGGSLEATD